jgi:hypothetical protein
MIIFTPIDLPKLEPDNWDKFWEVWNNNAAMLTKTRHNVDTSEASIGSSDVWKGLDIYKFPTAKGVTVWDAPLYDISVEFPNMFSTIMKMQETGLRIYQVRLITSLVDVKAHTDDNLDRWAYRSYFHYTSPKSQWYFTKPGEQDGNRHYINLPKDTNWFAYNDTHCWHGTDYDPEHPKILVQLLVADQTVATNIALENIEKYREHIIEL